MLSKEKIDFIAFNLLPGIGNITTRRLIEHFGSSEKAFNASYQELSEVEGISSNIVRKIVEERDKLPLQEELSLIEEHGCEVITINDSIYPPLLRNIYDPPIVLYVKGNLPPTESIFFSIVGTRKATSYGLKICRELSAQLASKGITIVSGLAMGIDTFAHQGALNSGGTTIAILGNGLSRIYPAENTDLANQIIDSDGALISEFPMGMSPIGKNFPRRNRIISGISLGVLVVEATEFSGSLITARHAAEQGREVFAVPGDIRLSTSKGTNLLINDGAKLVSGVEDIFSALPNFSLTSNSRRNNKPKTYTENLDSSPAKQSNSNSKSKLIPKISLTDDEKEVYEQISSESTHIDKIVRLTGFPPGKVSSTLLQLELKGIVKQLPGKNFVRSEG